MITATGRGFCAGADLRGAPTTRTDAGADTGGGGGGGADTGGGGERVAGDIARTIRQGAQRLITAVLDCEKPVIAAVNGTA
ncbi:enoyl-CoA hydratase, partial [Streptomyces pseudogriseolus]